MGKNAELTLALREAGVEPEDYEQIQQARRLIDAVNFRLASRNASLLFAVTVNPASQTPMRLSDRATVTEN
ncbi:MAG TPA: hypothetical protein VFQ44_01905 [Streptosporangiaceae bacterium]|nr:hypothetical protein [Streptosporangiaceae bacterium]